MPYVSAIISNIVRVRGASGELKQQLVEWGAQERAAGELSIELTSLDDLPNLLAALRDLGVAFAASSHGWGPAEVFATLRGENRLSGLFNEVVFGAHGEPRTRAR